MSYSRLLLSNPATSIFSLSILLHNILYLYIINPLNDIYWVAKHTDGALQRVVSWRGIILTPCPHGDICKVNAGFPTSLCLHWCSQSLPCSEAQRFPELIQTFRSKHSVHTRPAIIPLPDYRPPTCHRRCLRAFFLWASLGYRWNQVHLPLWIFTSSSNLSFFYILSREC